MLWISSSPPPPSPVVHFFPVHRLSVDWSFWVSHGSGLPGGTGCVLMSESGSHKLRPPAVALSALHSTSGGSQDAGVYG